MVLSLTRFLNTAFRLHSSSLQPDRLRWWRVQGLTFLLVLGSGLLLLPAKVRGARQSQKLSVLEILECAHARFAQGDYHDARETRLEVLPSSHHNFDILRYPGNCYYVTGPGGYGNATKYYGRVLKTNPHVNEATEKLSRCYLAQKRHPEAVAKIRLARLSVDPVQALKKAAEAYDAAGDYSKARRAYQAYLQRKPEDLLVRCKLARLDGLNKIYNQAVEEYRMVLSSNPHFIPAMVGIARIYSWQGQLDKSLQLYDRVLRFEPDNGEALSGKAYVLLWQDHYRRAHELFEELHSRYPRDKEVRQGLEQAQRDIEAEAFAAARKGDNVSELMDLYRERVAKNPHDVKALKALAAFCADINHCSQSSSLGRKAIEASSGAPDVELAVARALRRCGRYSEAVSYYRQYLQSHPGSEEVQYELGDTLRRARRFPEALKVFRRLVHSVPDNIEGQVGLGQALAATGEYDAALVRFNQVLESRPGYYDAMQGKAYVLFWKKDFGRARAIFQSLQKKDPQDAQNSQTLKGIARAEETAHWKALRPAAGASPHLWINFYRKRLAADPKDRRAMKGLAYQEAILKHRDAAVRDYRHVLAVYPGDRDAKLELARLLGQDGEYSAAIGFYREALGQDPEDARAQAGLARVYVWSGQSQKALSIYQQLLSDNPSKATYLLGAARMEIQLRHFDVARKNLGILLAKEPANRTARLELARLNTFQGEYDAARKEYDTLLKQDPQDPAALLGKGRISFYQGKLAEAHAAATRAVEKRPDDFSSVFLLASIEHAQHHRRKTLRLLNQAEKLNPGDAQVASLRNRVLSESRMTLSTTVAYAREIGPPSQANGRSGLANEDLRMYTYGTTIGINLIPKTNSYLSFTSNPSDSPPGPELDSFGNRIPTGITGATAPYEFLYRQSTRFGRRLIVRGGAGFVRFGPGDVVSIPGRISPVTGAEQRPVGLAGVSFGLSKKVTLDLDATKSAITYTPVSTRLGVIQDRLQGRINYFFSFGAQIHLAYWYGRYTSEDYVHTIVANGPSQSVVQADHDQGHGGSIVLKGQIVHSPVFSLDAGYEGFIYGYAGEDQNVYLGFFNPSFYQRHEFVPRIYGSVWGPLGYDISAGIGIQQTGRGGAITKAWKVSPNLSVRVSRHLRLIFGYTHYNTAQILGPLRGNEVRFQTEWQY